jgi:hypothetical protein
LSDWKRLRRARLSARLGFGAALASVGAALVVGLVGFAGPAAATGATTTSSYTLLPPSTVGGATPVAPSSLTGCSGKLSRDAQGNNWYDYSFSCTPALPGSTATGNIIAFSILATRQNIDGIQFDQNNIVANSSPSVYTAAGVALGNETVTCNAVLPSDGFDCNGEYVVSNGTTSTNLGEVPSGDLVQDQFQLSEAYCAYLQKKAKVGTPAVPRAVVNLLVTDDGGAQDGPFELTPAFKCAKVAAVVPAKKAKKTKKTAKAKTGKHAVKHGHSTKK